MLEGRASWDDVDRALDEERDFLRRFVAEQAIQTNEVQRSWMLLPAYLEASRRLATDAFDFVELGSSAGLNLVWDAYRYRYAHGTWGSADAPLELAGEELRPVPAELLAVAPQVRSRVGVDVAPLDATTDEGARLLRAFVWPDMTERLERLDAAIEVLRRDPPELVRGDLVELLPELLARGDGPVLVAESVVLAYVPREGRLRVYEALADAGARRPLAFVRTVQVDGETTFHGLELQVWPGGTRELVAHADFHGAWLEWLG